MYFNKTERQGGRKHRTKCQYSINEESIAFEVTTTWMGGVNVFFLKKTQRQGDRSPKIKCQ